MDSVGNTKARMNVEGEGDRLSMLPDDLIHKILSFVSIKYAVQTTALSSRWRFTWTSMPYLNISTHDFRVPSRFFNHFLSSRDSKKEVYWVKLCFRTGFSEVLLKRILDYAFSHNVQQLTVIYMGNNKIDFPLYLLRSDSLKYLSMSGSKSGFLEPYSIILASSTWELPALTTLHLDKVTFDGEGDDNNGITLFSKCANLRNLTITNFSMKYSRNFTVCHPRLCNLMLRGGNGYPVLRTVNVVAPQLENLTISSGNFGRHMKHMITTPNLVSFIYCSSCPVQFSTDLPSLEKVDLHIYSTDNWNVCNWNVFSIAGLLKCLHNVSFLTLNLEFVEPLTSYMEQISYLPSPFSNLKRLKIYPITVPSDDDAHKKINLSTEVVNYLLDNSPSAIFTLISYEEVKEERRRARALANAATAQRLIEDLQVVLEREKANIERDRDQRKTRIESQVENTDDDDEEEKLQVKKMQVCFETKMRQMKSFSEDMGARIDQGRINTCYILSRLCDIEKLILKELPPSKGDELKASYSGLCAEVDTVIKKILHRIKISQNHFDHCFNELDTTSLLPSS